MLLLSTLWSTGQCTLKVLVNFYPVLSEFLTCSFVYTNFWQLSMKIKCRLNFSPFWVFKPVFRYRAYCWSKVKLFHQKWKLFAPIMHFQGFIFQNGEKLGLDLIFVDNFRQNIKSFCIQNSMLKNSLKTGQKLNYVTVCTALCCFYSRLWQVHDLDRSLKASKTKFFQGIACSHTGLQKLQCLHLKSCQH